jgi:hypothetical protein
MKRVRLNPIVITLITVVFLVVFHPSQASGDTLINRIVVVMDDSIITQYDLQKAAVWNGMEYEKMSPTAKRELANQLINRNLVFQEINKTGGVRVDKNLLDSVIQSIKAQNPNPVFSDNDIEEYTRTQLLIRNFADQRFAPLVRIGEEEIRTFYNNFAATETHSSSPVPTLAESYDRIKAILEKRAIDSLLKDWLDKQRAIHKIRIIEPL